MKLVTVPQMIAIEKEADAGGLSYAVMMRNAGSGLAEIIAGIVSNNDWDNVFGLVGPGNNGGDTLIALAQLAGEGWHVQAYVFKRRQDDELVTQLLDAGGRVTFAEADADFGEAALEAALSSADVLLDGLLGTGFKLPLKDDAAAVLEQVLLVMDIMDEPPFVIAVDCPSGVDCDSGETAIECIPADLTVCMAAVKQGLLKLPAFELVGELTVVDIGLPLELDSFYGIKTEVADHELVAGLLPDRPLDSHKGMFGTALIAAGSQSYTGAALLAGTAAYRVGVGLVTLAVPEPLHPVLAGQLPEATWVLLPHEAGFISEKASDVLLNHLQRPTAFLLGPGLGAYPSTAKFVEKMISSVKLPSVVDADGLRHLSQVKDWHKKIFSPAILTPHIGEMSALTGLSREEILQNKNEVALKYAKEWGCVVVLKGAFTVIASPDGKMMVIPVASPALARAGTGDVLAGLIVGLLAQGLDAYNAAVAGAFIHAQAGLIAAEDLGSTASVLAGDLLNSIPDVMSELE
ncbi:MAG: NAD(P)H-hydrate dehydratase [Chloroflexi bacterium]|nr:NAD(P)H-hydrate dehydratase [Chloroflexota bacterium]